MTNNNLIKKVLPDNYQQYVDKYFLLTKTILEKENLNPIVGMNVFARGSGKVAGLEETAEILKKYAKIDSNNGEIWITKKTEFTTKDSLLIIKAPIQSFVDLETIYLGILSSAITKANNISEPNYDQIKEKFLRLKSIYADIPIIYFGARHYHWSLDKLIAKAALEGGASQTSTDIGSSNINSHGIGTMPHAFILIVASIYGKEEATLMAAKLFDKHIPIEISKPTILVDTFNKEITDSLKVANYFGSREFSLRIDTCGENIGENCSKKLQDSDFIQNYETGNGVTIELVKKVRNALIASGFGNNSKIFLSSGFGNENKALAFIKANKEYYNQTGYNLFSGVGIGEAAPGIFCTADIFEVNGKPLAKTGRKTTIDYSSMYRII